MKHIKSIGIGLLAIGGFIFFLGFKVKNYNLFFLLTGGIIAAIGFVLSTFIEKREEKIINNEFLNWKSDLINKGIKVEVDLDKCEIKFNSYREEVIKDYYSPSDKYMALDALVGKDNREFQNVNQSILVYKTEVHGNSRTFYSPIIAKDEISLTFLLGNKKKTLIYVDRLDKDNYYFDLEFLNE